MQPGDDQPLRSSLTQQPPAEQFARQARPQGQGPKITKDLQKEQPPEDVHDTSEQSVGAQSPLYRGVSEQVTFPSPPELPGAAGTSNRPGVPGGAPAFNQPGQAGSRSAPAWGYPPRPEYYRGGAAMQPGTAPGGSPGQPFSGTAPGQAGRSPQVFNAPFYSSATVPARSPGRGLSGAPVSAPPRGAGLRASMLVILALLLALVFGTGIFAGWQFGRNGAATSPGNNGAFQPGAQATITVPQQNGSNADAVREAVINKVQPSIVQIDVSTGSQQALGSGVIIDRRGYIVTNNHVVARAATIQVTLANNQALPATLVGSDAIDDLAVIKITPPPGGLTTATLGDSSQLRAGQEVLAIGSPLGNAETVTRGIISALNRNVSEGQNGPILPDAIQTDAPINPGNSGGALVDLQGNLVGMPTLNAVDTEFNTPANGLGFAIPVNRIRYIAQQIIADGHVTHTGRAVLGMTVTTITPALAAQNHLSVKTGVLIVTTVAGGPSASVGLREGDVIVQLGERAINSANDLNAVLLQDKPGQSVPVKVNRGGQQLTFNVTLGELAAG